MRTTIAVAVLFLVAVGAVVSPPHVTYQVKSLLTPSSDQDKCFTILKLPELTIVEQKLGFWEMTNEPV